MRPVRTRRPICYYAVATHLGGGERSLLELLKGLKHDPAGSYEPWVILPKKEGPLVERLKAAGIEYECLPIPKSFFQISRGAPMTAFQLGLRSVPGMSLYLARLVYLLRKRKPALIHTNAVKCHALAAVVGPASGLPVVWHLRDILEDGPTLWSLRTMSRTPSIHLVANSQATADAFGGKKGRTGISVIHNGLDPSVYARRPNRRFHELMKVPENVPIVGIVGVLARWKGQFEFLRMAAKLVESSSPARFVVIGDEIYDTVGERGVLHELREEAKRLGILDRVLFTGFVDDPAQAINGLDILVHASTKPEPFGRVVLESMACGVPVVASGAGGVLEMIENGRNGLLFAPGNVTAMAEAVGRLVGDQALRMKLAEQGHIDFLDRFTNEKYVEAVEALYDRILA